MKPRGVGPYEIGPKAGPLYFAGRPGPLDIGTYTRAVLATAGLAAYWRLGDTGIRALDVGTQFPGTYVGAPTQRVVGALPSELDTAVTFNGSSQYVSVPPQPANVTNNYSAECIVKLASLSSQLAMFVYNGNDVPGQGGWGVGIGDGSGGSGLKLVGLLGQVAWVDSGYTFTDTNWHHIIMVREAGTTKFYVDGIPTSGTSASAPVAPPDGLTIGAQIQTAGTYIRFFSGSLDEAAVYTAPITATVATQHARAAGLLQLHAAAETDAAQVLVHTKHATETPAAETDAAQALSHTKHLSLTPAAETDAAQTLVHKKNVAITASTEADAALALSVTKTIYKSLTPAAETDAAQTLAHVKQLSITSTAESDAAQAFSQTKHVTLTPAAETDAAQTLSHLKQLAVTPAAETDTAQTLSVTKTIFKSLTAAAETDTAQVLTLGARNLVAAVELDTARVLVSTKRVSLTPAAETDSARPLSWAKHLTLTPGVELDEARPLVGGVTASTRPGPNYLVLGTRQNLLDLDAPNPILVLGDRTTQAVLTERVSGAELGPMLRTELTVNDNPTTRTTLPERHQDVELDAPTKELTLDAA